MSDTLRVILRGRLVDEVDPRNVWQRFADHYYLFRGTPTGIWLEYELHEVFGVRDRLSGETAARIYDEIVDKLAAPDFDPSHLITVAAILSSGSSYRMSARAF